MCVQSYTIEVRNAHLNGVRLNAHWYKEHTCRRKLGSKNSWSSWCRFEHVIHQQGQQWDGRALVWQKETIETYVRACWDEESQQAWILISDRPAGVGRIHEDARRMRVEATFQDAKRRGWTSEASLVKERARLDRLLLALFLALGWVSHLAASCIHHGQRHRFDRRDRRDKSIFGLGRLWLLDMLHRATTACVLTRCFPFQRKGTTWKVALRF